VFRLSPWANLFLLSSLNNAYSHRINGNCSEESKRKWRRDIACKCHFGWHDMELVASWKGKHTHLIKIWREVRGVTSWHARTKWNKSMWKDFWFRRMHAAMNPAITKMFALQFLAYETVFNLSDKLHQVHTFSYITLKKKVFLLYRI
jgi:hypothetical protein